MSKSDSRDGADDSSGGMPGHATGPSIEPSIGAPIATGRRDFLKLGGALFAIAALPEWLASCGPSTPAGRAAAERIASLDLPIDPTAWFRVARPADMLWVDFNFVGLTHNATAGTLTPTASSTPGIILVRFPPQHIEEQTVAQPATGNPTSVPAPPVGTQIAGATQLAFVVPNGQSVPYDLPTLLTNLSTLNLNVAPNAYAALDDTLASTLPVTSGSTDPDQAVGALQALLSSRAANDVVSDNPPPVDTDTTGNAPTAPAESQTAIELPYQLIISPSQSLRFAHSGTPYQPNGSTFTELWTTRLARASVTSPTGVDDSARTPVSARAIWNLVASDPIASPALPSANRGQLVTQTSDRTQARAQSLGTQPFHVRRLLLSARGGSLDTLAEFQSPLTTLVSWQHRASYARDNYVKVEQLGLLFPWGHLASLVTVSERKFLANPGNGGGARTAYLWKEQFVVILQPVMAYELGGAANWAFSQMRILTPSTPPLDAPPSQTTPTTFWPSINGTAFRFSVQFVDWDHNVHQTEAAAIFIPLGVFNNGVSGPQNIIDFTTDFTTTADPDGTARNQADFRRQRVAYAPPKPGTTGTTSVETQLMSFSGKQQEIEPGYVPLITQTRVNIPSVRQFTGSDDLLTFQYPQSFIDQGGFSAQNPGEVFLGLAQGSGAHADFGAQSQRGGGFLTPSAEIVGLSRLAGPVSGSSRAATTVAAQLASFDTNAANDPATLFAGALSSAKLFGCFTLGQLFGPGGVGGLLSHASLPKFASEFLDEVGVLVRTLGQVASTLQDLENQATNAASSFASQLTTQLTTLATDVGAFLTAISTLPPSTTFVSTASSALTTVGGDVSGLTTTVKDAQSTNATLLSAARVPDTYFASALSVLSSASSMIASPQVTAALSALATASQAALNMTAHLDWQTRPGNPGDIRPIGFTGANNIFAPTSTTVLKLSGEVRAHDVAGKPAGLDITAALNDFDINLVGDGSLAFMSLRFKHLIFASLAGQKPNIDVGFGGITFRGPLQFLNALKDIIPLNGFSDPPGITVNTQGIQGDFSVALPALSVGVFTLENINLGANFAIPFIGEPLTVGFHFSERDNPFHLTVSLLGGGGYFLMDFSLQGVVLIEASIEFGAEASINLCVASGSVLVMAGIYFRYAPAGSPAGVALTGYFRIAGSMSVLGLITASVEMRLDLGYEGDTPASPPNAPTKSYAVGKATISIEVSILFFSESVDVSCEKKFAACSGDPTFADVMGPTTPGGPLTAWNEYCAAFAA